MGSGFKTFSAATKLTASDVNNYLMEQSVMYFATTAARDSAITAPEDGMVVYVGSNDSSEGLYTYNGTAWRKGPGWNAPWGVVGQGTTTSSTSTTTSSTSWTGLSVTWTAVSNRVYRTTLHGFVYSDNSGGSDYVDLVIANGSDTQLAASRALVQLNVYEGRTVQYVETNVSGSQTRKARVTRVSGTGNVQGYAAATYQASILVEDLGPSGAPV